MATTPCPLIPTISNLMLPSRSSPKLRWQAAPNSSLIGATSPTLFGIPI
jgi:hypothetical protein